MRPFTLENCASISPLITPARVTTVPMTHFVSLLIPDAPLRS